MRSSLKGPVSYRVAIVLTAVGLVIFGLAAMLLMETSGMMYRTTLEKWLILVGLISGLGLFVIGVVDGAQREVEQLEEEKRHET